MNIPLYGIVHDNTLDGIILYSILTGEIGKPSDKNIDNFIDTFKAKIKNGVTTFRNVDNIETRVNKLIESGDIVDTGNWKLFYKGLPVGATEDELLEYIENFKEVTPEINLHTNSDELVTDDNEKPQVNVEITTVENNSNQLDENEENSRLKIDNQLEDREGENFMSLIKDKLKHSVRLHLYDIRSNDVDAIVDYNAKYDKYYLKAGSRIRKQHDNSMSGATQDRRKSYYKSGKYHIDNDSIIVEADIEFTSMSGVVSFVFASNRSCNGAYVYSTEGKDAELPLGDIINDDILYDLYIASRTEGVK
ncbi:MAG: DUF4357 domain-containing protein [Lachnospiraceae bacterium]|nr:DUF4357 domain-containing protein [Lachnospiraceae bacterium]